MSEKMKAPASAMLDTEAFPSVGGDLQSVVNFSSKALHHYLLLTDKLIAEKDIRLEERQVQLNGAKQDVADLESYVKLLENEVARLKEKPEGWF